MEQWYECYVCYPCALCQSAQGCHTYAMNRNTVEPRLTVTPEMRAIYINVDTSLGLECHLYRHTIRTPKCGHLAIP